MNTQFGVISSMDVGGRARSGAMWSALQIVVRNVVSIGVAAVLARILAPQDYGLLGMVATLTALLNVFSDMGLSWATVQVQKLSSEQVSGLFWINATIGFLFWGVITIASPALAAFYKEPILTSITPVIGLTFLFSGIAVQPMALLTRSMDFKSIAIVEIISLLGGALVGICLALTGAGYWALIAQGIIQAAARALLALRAAKFRVYRFRRNTGITNLIHFGSVMMLSGVLIYLARNLDSVLIGRVWGAAELGVYNRAYFLMLLPSTLANGALSALMVASLSRLQSDPDRFADAYRRALRLVAYVGTPMALGLAITAKPAVELVYGPNWTSVATLLSWLSIAGITQPIYNTNGWLFTASGKAWPYLILTIANSVLLSAMFFMAIPHGVLALSQGYGLVMGLAIPIPALWFAHRVAGISFGRSLRALGPVATLNVLMAVAAWSTGEIARVFGLSVLQGFPIQVLAGAAVYLALTPILLNQMLRQDLLPLIGRLRNNLAK